MERWEFSHRDEPGESRSGLSGGGAWEELKMSENSTRAIGSAAALLSGVGRMTECCSSSKLSLTPEVSSPAEDKVQRALASQTQLAAAVQCLSE